MALVDATPLACGVALCKLIALATVTIPLCRLESCSSLNALYDEPRVESAEIDEGYFGLLERFDEYIESDGLAILGILEGLV